MMWNIIDKVIKYIFPFLLQKKDLFWQPDMPYGDDVDMIMWSKENKHSTNNVSITWITSAWHPYRVSPSRLAYVVHVCIKLLCFILKINIFLASFAAAIIPNLPKLHMQSCFFWVPQRRFHFFKAISLKTILNDVTCILKHILLIQTCKVSFFLFWVLLKVFIFFKALLLRRHLEIELHTFLNTRCW